MFLTLTAGSPDVDKSDFLRRAARRYQTIVERVTASLSAGKTWVDELPKEVLSPTLPEAPELARPAGTTANGQ